MKKIIGVIAGAMVLTGFLSGFSARAEVKIKWFGQSCFLITSPDGVKILLDPFGPQVGYPMPEVSPDLVLITHEHYDHNYAKMAKGNAKVIHGLDPATQDFNRVSETIKDVKVYSVPSDHDDKNGKERGKNAIMALEMPGMRIIHLGDLGAILSEEQLQKIGRADVLLIPVGGTYTIDAEQATRVVEQLKPKLIFPMHYKTAAITIPLRAVDDFLSGKSKVRRIKGNEYLIKTLPEKPEIIVLDYK